jgi:hypothetical protein
VRKILLTAVTLALAIGGATAVFAAGDDTKAPRASSTVEDVSGPCDEAEHANDPRCEHVGAPAGGRVRDRHGDRNRDADRNRGAVEDDRGVVDDDQEVADDNLGVADDDLRVLEEDPRSTTVGPAV